MVINTKIQIWDPRRTQPTYNCGLYQVLSHKISGCCHGAMLPSPFWDVMQHMLVVKQLGEKRL